MLAGEQPTCWTCERTEMTPEFWQVLEIAQYRELGMSWELALEAACWIGSRDDLRTLARRLALLQQSSGQKPPNPAERRGLDG